MVKTAALALVLVLPALAHADEPLLVGARVGGYGFRQAPGPERDDTGWEACRMGGMGVFAELPLSRRFFLEGGLDAYFAEEAGNEASWAIDRFSGLMTVAGGAYLVPGARFSPYVQAGLGMEVTHVSVGTQEDSFVLPLAFIGLGADVRVGPARLGASLRVNAMGYFDPADRMSPTAELAPEAELATQGQFYAKFFL
jgi:hypothetical protein